MSFSRPVGVFCWALPRSSARQWDEVTGAWISSGIYSGLYIIMSSPPRGQQPLILLVRECLRECRCSTVGQGDGFTMIWYSAGWAAHGPSVSSWVQVFSWNRTPQPWPSSCPQGARLPLYLCNTSSRQETPNTEKCATRMWFESFKIIGYVKIALCISPGRGARIKTAASFKVKMQPEIDSILIKTPVMSFLHRLHMPSMTTHSAVVLIDVQTCEI